MASPEGVQSVTTAPQNLRAEQDTRLRNYLVTMAIRILCFILAVVLTGWLRWAAVAGAVLLPYVAVVFANAVGPRAAGTLTPATPVTPLLAPRTDEVLEGRVVPPRAPEA